MNLRHSHIASLLSGLSLAVGIALPAFAGLGGNAAGIAADSLALRATVQSTPLQSYELHEFTTDSGIHLREYVTRSGLVFAVAWSGPVMPDLRVLLGVHFDAYAEALAAPQKGLHKSLSIDTPSLVLQSGGHLRSYVGRAYLPSLLPAGTTPAEFR